MANQYDICPVCKGGFVKKRHTQKYCTGKCRWRSRRGRVVTLDLHRLPADLKARIAEYLASEKRVLRS